jgi:mitochondrial fission protein ELM1
MCVWAVLSNSPERSALEPPWPDLLIATGRHSVAASLHVKAKSRGRTRTVQVQNPVISPNHFDLVIVPRHDQMSGANVLSTRGALHRVTADVLRDGAARLGPQLGSLPRPYVGVLIGGSNGAYRLEAARWKPSRASSLRRPKRRAGVCSSRRRGARARSLCAFSKRTSKASLITSGKGPERTPISGFSASRTFLVVTCDSVNMVCEAASTSKPVYVVDLPGGSAKFERFHRLLREEGVTRPFAGALERYSYSPLDDMASAAARVKALLPR